MNRRGLRVREYYGLALIAGIDVESARRMAPGFILDMYVIRAKYDARLAMASMAGKMIKRMGMI